MIIMKKGLEKIKDWIKSTYVYKSVPYWVAHGMVGLIICLIFNHWSAGFIFYAGREIRDVEKLHNWDMNGFDWKGLLSPLVVSIILYLIKL